MIARALREAQYESSVPFGMKSYSDHHSYPVVRAHVSSSVPFGMKSYSDGGHSRPCGCKVKRSFRSRDQSRCLIEADTIKN